MKDYFKAKLPEDGMVMQISQAFSSDGTGAKLEPRQMFLMILLSRVPPLFPFALINYAVRTATMSASTRSDLCLHIMGLTSICH